MKTMKTKSKVTCIWFVFTFAFLFCVFIQNLRIDSFKETYKYGSLSQKVRYAISENLFAEYGLDMSSSSNEFLRIMTDNEYEIYYYSVDDYSLSPYAKICKRTDEFELEIEFFDKYNRVTLNGGSYSYWFICDDSLNVKSEHYFILPIEDEGQLSKNSILRIINENILIDMIDFYYSYTNELINDLYSSYSFDK